jgi:parvulin-like peptidyl-prolyl isomerase
VNSFFKALVVIVVVAAIAGLGIYAQNWTGATSSGRVALTADELNLFADKNLGFREKSQLSGDADARKKFLERLGKQLSLAAEADRRGLGDSDFVKAIEAIGAAQILQDAYSKAHPEAATGPQGARPSDEEIQGYLAANGETVDRYIKALESQAEGMPLPKREDIAAALIVADKAKAEGLDSKDKETELQLKLNRYGALIQALVTDLEKQSEYTDEQVDAYYRENAATGMMDKVHVQHILLATVPMPNPANPFEVGEAPNAEQKREQAEQLLARARNNEDFGALANEFTDDPSGKGKGGDLGWSERFKFVPEFEEAAWKLQPGQISDVVKTEYGYHIIKMVERQPAPELTPELKARLKDTLSQQKFEAAVDEIAKRNPVVLPNDFVVKAPEMPPMGNMPGMMNPHGAPGADPHGGMEPEGEAGGEGGQ